MATPLCPFWVQTQVHSYIGSHLASDKVGIGPVLQHEHPEGASCTFWFALLTQESQPRSPMHHISSPSPPEQVSFSGTTCPGPFMQPLPWGFNNLWRLVSRELGLYCIICCQSHHLITLMSLPFPPLVHLTLLFSGITGKTEVHKQRKEKNYNDLNSNCLWCMLVSGMNCPAERKLILFTGPGEKKQTNPHLK